MRCEEPHSRGLHVPFLTGHEGDERLVLCCDAETGKTLWRRSLVRSRQETFHPRNGPTTPTPVTDGRSVFVFLPELGLVAFDFSGQELWRTPLGPFVKDALGEYYASPVAGDGKIYLASLDGKVSVLKAGADWEVLSTFDLGEPVIATPAIADGRVFVRTETALYAFGIKPGH
jgi:outer membrane protein assembly factor BamB